MECMGCEQYVCYKTQVFSFSLALTFQDTKGAKPD